MKNTFYMYFNNGDIRLGKELAVREIDLFKFLRDNMDDNNLVLFDPQEAEAFKKITGYPFSKNYIHMLHKKGFVIKLKRCFYQLNPEIIWKGKLDKRLKCINNKLSEREIKIQYERLIDQREWNEEEWNANPPK